MDPLFLYGLPAGALVIGAIAFFLAMRDSRKFDLTYSKDFDTLDRVVPTRTKPLT